MIEYTVKVYEDRTEWYHNNLLHCEDGPAIEWKAPSTHHHGRREYWQNGKRHRVDGPALITEDGDEFWFLNGDAHRKNGPAIVYINDDCEYWVDGNRLSPDEFYNYSVGTSAIGR